MTHISYRVPDFCMTLSGPRGKPSIATYRKERGPLQGSCQFHIIPTIYWANTWKIKPIQLKARVSEPKQNQSYFGPTQRGRMMKNGTYLTEQTALAPSILTILWWNFTHMIMRHYRKTTNWISIPMKHIWNRFDQLPPPPPLISSFNWN